MACHLLWTEEEEKIIRALIEAGVSIEDAYPIFKTRSRESLRTKTRNMGLKWPQGKAEIDHELFKKLMRGK